MDFSVEGIVQALEERPQLRPGAAVLVPLVETGEGLAVVLEVRAHTLSVQPGEVCLADGHGELPQSVQLGFEQLEVYLLLVIGNNVRVNVHLFAGFCPGEGFHFPDLPVNGITGLLKMKIFFLRGWMFG